MIQIKINGKQWSAEKICRWEERRARVSRRTLEKRMKRPVKAYNADDLAAFKAGIPDDEIRRIFRSELAFTAVGTGLIVRISGGRRKFSTAEIDVDFCDAETLHRMYDDMMLNNTGENRFCCLRANPDHYLLRGIGNEVQEVLEITGGLPVVSLFEIRYGDFEGLRSPQDPDYPLQAAGVSYLKNGLAIGAVRHQMKDTKKGCHVKLTVEFPALMPDRNIQAHQYHLACEFYNWFSEFERRLKEGQAV